MKGIYKSHGAAQTAQALKDYGRLFKLGQEISLSYLVPSIRANAGWRTIDKAAKQGVENLLRKHPELRDKLREIYPGFVGQLEREDAPLVKPRGKCVELEAEDGVIWKL